MKIKNIVFQKSNSTINGDSVIFNPELEGGSFFWKGGGTGVLLLHGLTATTAEVRPLAKRLFKEGYTVSSILLPGHGTTPENLSQTHREDWIKASEVAYNELKRECSSVIVGGESVGALLALRLASDYPEIKGLLLYAPAMRLAASFLKIVLLVHKIILMRRPQRVGGRCCSIGKKRLITATDGQNDVCKISTSGPNESSMTCMQTPMSSIIWRVMNNTPKSSKT